MPVPLPEATEEDLTPPTQMEHDFITRGLATAPPSESGLTDLQADLLGAIMQSMTGRKRDVRALRQIEPDAFAAGLRHRGALFRLRLVHHMALVEMVLQPEDQVARARVDRFAHELGVGSDSLDRLRATEPRAAALIEADFNRNQYLRRIEAKGAARTATAGIRPDLDIGQAWTQSMIDPDLARSWLALAELPPDSLGRQVHEMYLARGFVFPGLSGSAPPLLAQHDWVHVLADYGTTLESELEVFAFIARASDDPSAFALIAMVVNLFETGRLKHGAGLFEASPGHLSTPGMSVRFADALYRGAATLGHNDFLSFDWLSVAAVPVADLRDNFGIPPKSDAVQNAGSPGPFDPSGITSSQAQAGTRMSPVSGAGGVGERLGNDPGH